MICKDCTYFNKIANTDETNQGICSYPTSFTLVDINSECIFALKPYTCGDCDRYGDDLACITCEATDSAYREHGLCSGFIDKQKANVINALTYWALRGYNVDERLEEAVREFKEEFKLPWEE